MRSFRVSPVCLVLSSMCFLLLTAVIELSVFIYTNYTKEKHQPLSNIINITKDKDMLLGNITNLTSNKVQLQRSIANLTKERIQLLTNFTEEMNQLLPSITNINNDREQQITNTAKFTEERQQLIKKFLRSHDGWVYYLSSLYYLSNETKSWSESRQYCKDRGADLIIINNQQEQAFVESMAKEQSRIGVQDYLEIFWIGLSDSNEEGSWKWVDGSALTSGFFWPGKPNTDWKGYCAVALQSRWTLSLCYDDFKWICEKRI